MRNQDVEELFELVQVGDEVELATEVSAELANAFSENHAEKTVASVIGGGQ